MTPALASLEAEIGSLRERITALKDPVVPRHLLVRANEQLRTKASELREIEAKYPFDLQD